MRIGALVMAYGTPAGPADIEAYYTHIRRGRPPTAEQLADLRRRYDAIGGVSPLAARTEAQRAAIDAALRSLPAGGGDGDGGENDDDGERAVVVLGQKHAAPFVEDGVDSLAAAGVDVAVGIVLAPHYSRGSVGAYHERAAARAEERGIPYRPVDSWHTEPEYLDFLAAAVVEALASLPTRTKVLFTAHSLPERVLVDDPYPDQLRETAEAVARRAGLGRWQDWSVCWQSAGRTPEAWRGPDVLEVIRELGATGRCDGVLVCPAGFTADHLEVLYDLDVDAAAVADEVHVAFARTRMPNDDPAVMAALARRVVDAARRSPGGPSR